MSDDTPVNRCECIKRSFAQLLEFGSLEAAVAETGAGRECAGCLPYLKLAFATGETAFAIDDPRLAAYE
jgi:hypothetical protein